MIVKFVLSLSTKLKHKWKHSYYSVLLGDQEGSVQICGVGSVDCGFLRQDVVTTVYRLDSDVYIALILGTSSRAVQWKEHSWLADFV